ncbi:peptidoglycan-binding protein [Peribacillus frigoritolerans]|uniref:Autolysin n=1 Tax=Peribacillus castrilensis TaxID=2897690 RepID=A0AAW9NHH7_9BACI|nr:peptidoglycan-binding protein [Peribacillus castrilensis]
MQLIPEGLRNVLHDRLKSGTVSRPELRVEVDRFSFVPGYVEELKLYNDTLTKTIEEVVITKKQETVTKELKITFPLKGLTWSDKGKKFAHTSPFGMRWGRLHAGNDIATFGRASTIVAAWDGEVSAVSYQNPGAGYYVKIKHDEDIETCYFHMAKGSIAVSQGQKVKAGQKIGTEGATGGGALTGRHLHFEVREGGKKVDSLPWLQGKKTITGKQTISGGLSETSTKTITKERVVPVPGAYRLNEQMRTSTWMNNRMYTIYNGTSVSMTSRSLGNGYYRTYWGFNGAFVSSASINFDLNMPKRGLFSMNFSGNLHGNVREFLQVYINNKLVLNNKNFLGVDVKMGVKDIPVPAGQVKFNIIMMADGTMGTTAKKVAIHSITVKEVDGSRTETYTEDEVTTKPITPKKEKKENYVFKEVPVDLQLQTGRFVYQDTIVVPNVIAADVNRDLDAEAAEATVTITNPDGYYSPDFNPYYFPELTKKYGKESPWSYYIPGNFHVGTLSENTPIRIYAGYGDVQKPMRLFTGLIDSTDINGGDGTLTVKARDMYKKILNATLMKRKEYGNDAVYETPKVVPKAETSSGGSVTFSSLSRRQQILVAAKLGQLEFGLPEESYYLLLAISYAETQLGTTGQGREPKNMILGYGAYDSGSDVNGYGGIQRQMHYGAKRIRDAMKSRQYKLSSLSDAWYLHKGGDYGSYQWATDRVHWGPNVWSAYKKFMANKKDYQPSISVEKLAYKPGSPDGYGKTVGKGAPKSSANGGTTTRSAVSTTSAAPTKYTIQQKMIPGVPTLNYRNGKGKYEGVVAHATAVNEQTADQIYNYFKGNYKNAWTHFAVDWTEIQQYSKTDYKCYGAGRRANERFVHVELCQSTNKQKFQQSYNRYVWLLAKILRDKKLGVSRKKSFWTHHDVTKTLGGTTHTDPDGYLKTWGITTEELMKDVAACYKKDSYRPFPSADNGYWDVSPDYGGKLIKSGSKDRANVKRIQEALNKKGYSVGTADGLFGPKTVAAVKKFQRANKLSPDGIVGPKTWNELFGRFVSVTPVDTKPKVIKEGKQWLKSAIIADLVSEAGLNGWRVNYEDMKYPDTLIEESYYIDANVKTGKVVRALPADKAMGEKKFETVSFSEVATQTPKGWFNPYAEPPVKYYEVQHQINELITELIKETTYRSYCDRYGTYRLELIDLDTPVVATYRSDENMISLTKNIDYSRSRNHLVIYDEGDKDKKNKDYEFGSFIDKELLLEHKGEVKTAVVVVPWAKTNALKKEVARKLFFDMKRNARTLQISIPGNPALDILDRIKVIDRDSATSATYHIKAIKDSIDVNAGFIQIIDLTWAAMDQFIQIPGLVMNVQEPDEPKPKKPPAKVKESCVLWNKKYYRNGDYNDSTVKKIQQKLDDLGYSLGAIDSDFGSRTERAVKAFQKNKKLKQDGIVGQLTWNAMFCPSWKRPAEQPTKTVPASGMKTRSWRDNWKWRSDTDHIYQGEWENWGRHYGYIFFPTNLRGKLKGKKIKSVKLYLKRYSSEGVHSKQYPTFWLSTKSTATGSPQVISGSSWKSNVGWDNSDGKWVTLPKSYGEAIRDGKAKSIAIHVSGRSPYMRFYGGKSVKIEVETY